MYLSIAVVVGACAQGRGALDEDTTTDKSETNGASRPITNDSTPEDYSLGLDRPGQDSKKKDAGESSKPLNDGGSSPPTPPTGKKRAFVTSIKYFGNLGGLAGADSKCTKSASIAQIGGTWKAWVSVSGQNAVHRIKDVGPWYTVDGKTKVYNDMFDVIDKPLVVDTAWLDELGNSVNEQINIWTGTKLGKATGYDCDDWTSNGSFGTYRTLWQDYTGSRSCSDMEMRLLCLEQ